jgi:hypothetical protein
MCGWTNGISYYSNDLNTEFDALQVTLAQAMWHGLSATINYQWAAAFDDNGGYSTWTHSAVVHQRDGNVRQQQMVGYGSYDLPFGKGKQYLSTSSRALDLLVGGYQISSSMNWASGLPWTVGFDQFAPGQANPEDCFHNVGGTSAPCRPNAHGHMSTNLTKFDPATKSRSFFNAQPRSGGIFTFPGLDVIGNAGANTYWGPRFFSANASLSKAFNIWESVSAVFRMDAFNVFNHITANNPNNGDVFVSTKANTGDPANNINSEAAGCYPAGDCGPRQLEFSLRLQF